jgi:hypothetical protein
MDTYISEASKVVYANGQTFCGLIFKKSILQVFSAFMGFTYEIEN